jgi:hypothetical protein
MNLRGLAGKQGKSLVLLAGDLVTLIAFIYIGQRDHDLIDPANPLMGVLLPAAVFALPWVITAFVLGAYDAGGEISVRKAMGRSVNTWLVAAPLGLLLRALVLGRAVIPTVFISAALGFGGAMILGWRLAFFAARQVAINRARRAAA